MNIAVYGIGKCCEHFLSVIPSDVRVICFVQTKPVLQSFHGKPVISPSEIDYSCIDKLVVATNLYFDEVLKSLFDRNLMVDEYKKITHVGDFLELIKPSNYRMVPAYCKKSIISYVYRESDKSIGPSMKGGNNFSSSQIKRFFSLTDEFYFNYVSGLGYFFDIGANIGTTSIFVKKEINTKLNVIGFEPLKNNYDLFRCNCILNGVEDIKTEHIGISNTNGEAVFRFIPGNPGMSGLLSPMQYTSEIETVPLITLDEYCKQNKIRPFDIKYIWLDVEGHEPQVLDGMRGLLDCTKIPILHEFTPHIYKETGVLELYFSIVKKYYKGFVDIGEEENYTPKPISEIKAFTNKMLKNGKIQTDLFLF